MQLRGESGERLSMTRRDIADYLRLASETVSRLMTRFRTDGFDSLPWSFGHDPLTGGEFHIQ